MLDHSWTKLSFLLRYVQLGIGIQDLEMLKIGMALDMYKEMERDGEEWIEEAGQEVFDGVWDDKIGTSISLMIW